MHYKRTEYFRYTFGTPLEAKFQIAVAEGSGTKSGIGACSLIDISPSGAKLYTKFDIPFGQDSAQIHLNFKLYETEINVEGKFVWKGQYRGAHLYGMSFEEDLIKEQLIVDELKLLSRLELEKKKK